ncbi:MAG TPA: hypothetical protein GXX46_04105 [Peptococcaceae bacterium]|nr:hypothetical protein [Peptococcaceae bacterium]
MRLVKIKINDETISGKIKFRLRLDFRAEEKSGRFFFGGKSSEVMAEAVREQQMGILKNVPLQGLTFEDFDASMDIYLVNEGDLSRKKEVAYAPLLVTVSANNLEDIFPLLLRPEFKKIEVLEPESITIERLELERLLYSLYKNFKQELKNLALRP